MKNDIVLIGMPAAGKSSVAPLLAKLLDVKAIDIDNEIENFTERTVSDIILKDGEGLFRDMEAEFFEKSVGFGNIIACGGGIVCNEKALPIIKNTVTVYINRPLELIIKDGEFLKRPLIKNGISDLYALYEKRRSLYEALADITVINDGSLEALAEKIIREVKKYENNDN